LCHLDTLYHFALLLTGNEHLAEDLVSDTYLKAHRLNRSPEYGTHSKTWLFTTLYTIFINKYHQGGGTVLGTHRDEDEYEYEPPPDWGMNPVAIRKALAELPERLKAVVLLKDVFGFDSQEIANILECPVEMVSSWLGRGRTLLKKRLKSCCQGRAGILSGERRYHSGDTELYLE
jgi:RNA polymerase sigma-70 factor (ECF subfamily)